MIYTKLSVENCSVEVSSFDAGRRQGHAMVHTSLAGEPFVAQLASVLSAAEAVEAATGMTVVFRRYFLSDAPNQASLLPATEGCARSVIRQSPLDGTKVALWLVLEGDADYAPTFPGEWTDSRGRVLTGDVPCGSGGPREMTVGFLEGLASRLAARGGSLLDNCVRTWFMVRDVDVNYGGVVKGRNEVFAREGLDRTTHFIASTGIEGAPADHGQTVAFNAVSDLGLRPGQMRYLHGASHLNPTIEYGVAFERGTAVDYRDRRHVYISGTASIDNHGCIVHPGDIAGQTERMLENIAVLLAEGDCGWTDVAHMIVYLRDIADYAVVRALFDARFPDIPRVIVQAPVCRPGWLIETECMAIRKARNPEYAEF